MGRDRAAQAEYTGYDMHGLLCPKLSDSQCRQKQEMEAELRKDSSQVSFGTSLHRAWRLSKVRRWGRATIGTILPPLRILL